MQIHIKPSILLVEDSVDDAFFFRWALDRHRLEAEVVHAPDGVTALQLLQEARSPEGHRRPGCPDIVFLDLKMPVVSGFDVLAWLREHPFHPPLEVAVLSGSDREVDRDRALALGATFFYIKPLSGENLRKHLDVWRKQRGARGGEQP